jgi:hypothetical protein
VPVPAAVCAELVHAARDLGLASSMFTQPIDVAVTRERLRMACRRPFPPHAVLRFGYGQVPHRTGRRSVDEVISPES